MSYEYDELSIEELLTDVDVVGKPGIFWTIVGTVSLLSLFAINVAWRLFYRMRR